MKTRAFREYDAATSRKTTREIQCDIDLIQSCYNRSRDDRKRSHSDIWGKLASIALYAGCAVSLVMLIKTAIG
jgi:hypothetical protein